MELHRPKEDKIPYICLLTFTAAGGMHGDIVQVCTIICLNNKLKRNMSSSGTGSVCALRWRFSLLEWYKLKGDKKQRIVSTPNDINIMFLCLSRSPFRTGSPWVNLCRSLKTAVKMPT